MNDSHALDKQIAEIENRPEVKAVKEMLKQLEELLKARTSDEDWDLLMEWESCWAQYAAIMADAIYQQMRRKEVKTLQEKRVQVFINYEDGGKIFDGQKITEHVALVHLDAERTLCICALEATPDPRLFLIGSSTELVRTESDHLFWNMAKDMHELTFSQFATRYEPVMREMLFNARGGMANESGTAIHNRVPL